MTTSFGNASSIGSRKLTLRSIKGIVLGSVDQLILEVLAQDIEVGAEAGHPNHQILIIIGILLGIQQSLTVSDIELDVIRTSFKIAVQEIEEVVTALVTICVCTSQEK